MEENKKYIKTLVDIIDSPEIVHYLRIVTEDMIKAFYEPEKGGATHE